MSKLGSLYIKLGEPEGELSGCCEISDWAADEIERLRAELETERMRLAACGVVALANTPDSAAQAREMLPEYQSASCDDVARMVDENMRLRAALESIDAYWNRDQNETAMANACWHAIETAQAALAPKPEEPK